MCNKIKVLIVEDEKKIMTSLKFILGEEKDLIDQIDIAFNGQEGLDLALKNEYDLILTDINMPIMNGDVMIRSLMSDRPNSQRKVYIYSGYAENEYNCQGLAHRYFEKPILIKEIIKAMRVDFEK